MKKIILSLVVLALAFSFALVGCVEDIDDPEMNEVYNSLPQSHDLRELNNYVKGKLQAERVQISIDYDDNYELTGMYKLLVYYQKGGKWNRVCYTKPFDKFLDVIIDGEVEKYYQENVK